MGRPERPSWPARQARRHVLRYIGTTVSVATAAAGVCVAADARMAVANWPELWQPIAFIAALVVAERCELRMPVRGHRHSSGFADAVIAIGLFWLPTGCMVAAAAIGATISQYLSPPPSRDGIPARRAFNAAATTLAAAAAGIVAVVGMQSAPGVHFPRSTLSRAADVAPVPSTRWYLVVLLAMAAYFLVSHTMSSYVVSLQARRSLRRTWRHGAPLATAHWGANTAYGVLAAALAGKEPGLLPALAAPVGISALADQAWSRSLALRQRVQLLYGAGRILARRLGDPRSWRVFVRKVARALDCEGAVVFLGRPDDRAVDVIATDGPPRQLTTPPQPAAWERAAWQEAGHAGWADLTLVPLENDGQVLGYLGVFGPRGDGDADTPDHGLLFTLANQAATALRNEHLYHEAESERTALHDIVSHSSDGIYTVGPDRSVRSWNPAMTLLTGWSAADAIGRSCQELLGARDELGANLCAVSCPIRTVAATGQEVVADAQITTRDADPRWIRYAHAPVLGSGGAMTADVVVVHDVTRERRAEEAKADFVANISHELRSPLTPIKGFLLTLLREDRSFDDDHRRGYYQLMLGQAERLEALVEDLLDLTRVEAGAGVATAAPVDAKGLAAQVVRRLAAVAPRRAITLTVPDRPVTVRGSHRRIDQVLGNLLSNAVRYTPEDGPVEVRVAQHDGEVTFQVRDTGPGIPPGEQARIFERFHRGGDYLTRPGGGAGLGLYLAKRLVEAMGGRIWVDSHPGEGATFSFALPATGGRARRRRPR